MLTEESQSAGEVCGLVRRHLPIGAEPVEGGVQFRVWAPCCKKVEVVLEGEDFSAALDAEPDGYFSGLVSLARVGALYRFRLDGAELLVPDPASRFQPDGP